MGWKHRTARRIAEFLLMTMAMASISKVAARAQEIFPPGNGPGVYNPGTRPAIGDNEFITIGNSDLLLSMGRGKNCGGSIGIFTTGSNSTDPDNTLFFYGKLIPPANIRLFGTRVFVRVDGGINGGQSGFDYEFGQPDTARGGVWLTLPYLVNSHLVARWQTYPHAPLAGTGGTGGGTGGIGGGTGGGTTVTIIDPKIEVDLVASFVHDQIRFQFNIINNDTGHSHTVGLAFLQDYNFDPVNFSTSAPIIIPNRPYLRVETALGGNDVPSTWLIQRPGPVPTGSGTTQSIHTVEGVLRPTATSGNEPTVPSRFVLGRGRLLEGSDPPPTSLTGPTGTTTSVPGPSGRYFDSIWGFVPNPNIRFDTAGSQDAAIVTFYDEQTIAPGQNIPITTYIGQGSGTIDAGQPISLFVTAPSALPFSASKPTSTFTVSAYVTNLLDLQPGAGISISPVSLSLDLPTGLQLANGDTATKAVSSIAPGNEGGVSWQVQSNGAATGSLRFTVTAAANVGSGKVVQRDIIVPSAPAIDLKGNANAKGLYQMLSFPLDFHGVTPSTALFPGQDPNVVAPDLAHFDATSGKYVTVPTFVPGQSYWVRSRITQDSHILLDPTTYPPLNNQIQPTSNAYKVVYNLGWNQIGNPYVYPINFAEVQIFDPDTLAVSSVGDASSPTNQLVLPAVYQYDTSDPNPSNWHYTLVDSIGFTMQPYIGYWLYVKKANLQFLYPGVDIPGTSVGRAALMGVGFKSRTRSAGVEKLGRGTSDNWRLKVSARSAAGYDPDNFIGVAPKATDNMDGYKYSKAPEMNKTLTLDIVHSDWPQGTRLAHDLRSPATGVKTWNMAVRSSKANDSVTLSWNSISRDVPRNYTLTLIDPATNKRVNMRSAASHIVNVGPTGTQNVQIVAEPVSRGSRVQITAFDVLTSGDASRATRSANIHFTLTRAASQMSINVLNGRGQIIRQLNNLSTRDAEGGAATGTALWDLKTQQGTTVSAGQYNVELQVQTEDGQRARRVQPLVITR